MMLLVGLGNPGSSYSHTRHNAGFIAVDTISHRYNFSSPKSKFSSLLSEGAIDGQRIIAIKPQTYMNNSGTAVREAAQFYKIPLEDILVCHDELDIALGRIKAKQGGGHGGHNGLRSLDSHLGKEYWRLRIGIGHPGDKNKVSDFVLGRFTLQEEAEITQVFDKIADNFSYLVKKDTPGFLNKLALI